MGSYYKKYANVNYFLCLASYAIEIFFLYPILEWIDRVQNSSCWVNRIPAGLPQENQTVLSVENFIKDLPKSAKLIPISARLIPMWNWGVYYFFMLPGAVLVFKNNYNKASIHSLFHVFNFYSVFSCNSSIPKFRKV